MSFFKNGGLIGKPFTDLRPSEYHAAMSINYGKNVAVLNSSARMPSEPYRRHDEVEAGGGGGGGEEEEEEWKRQLPTYTKFYQLARAQVYGKVS